VRPDASAGPSTSPLDAMANALILAFASAGVVGIILSIRALRYVSRSAARAPTAARWTTLRAGALIVGLVLAVASLVLVTGLSYPVSTEDGPGHVAGLPFFVAYFDSQGRDYVGLLSYIGWLGNYVFWLLVPQLVLAAYARRVVTRHGV